MATLLAACGQAVLISSGGGWHHPVDEVLTDSVGSLGTVLVNGHGHTLYAYMPDDRSGQSRCNGLCAAEWPPLALPTGTASATAGPGVDHSLLGVTTRQDGTRQVTYNGWPLYTWVNDTGPGQANGQGIDNLGGLWYALSPGGSPIRSSG
jgi:predicted lipoprotein with Yx(FWY)xxD motif